MHKPAWTHVWRPGTLVTACCLALLGLAAGPAAAADSGGAAAARAYPRVVRHTNVGAAHSPQLLRQLAQAASQAPAPGTRPAAPASKLANAVQGVDVASYQEKPGIDWAQAAAAGERFVAVKATEGAYYANPYAPADLTAAKAAGLTVVAYAFAIPNGDGASSSPVVQADYAIAHAADQYGNVPPVMLDIEYDPYASQDGTNQCYGLTTSAMVTWISSFSAEVKAKTGQPPVIYSTRDWWQACTGGTTALGQNPLWVAAVTGTSDPGTLPAGWSTWDYWQYGQGSVAGISGSVDLDQLDPGVLTLLDPGNQQDVAGSAIAAVPMHASQAGLTYSATGLPGGLSIDPGTGAVTGTPPATGSSQVTVTATSASASASVSFTWYVHGTLTVSSLADQSTVAGSAVDFPASATDSPAEPPVSFAAAGLPPGLSISGGGLITGWPDQPGTYQVTVSALDSLEAYGSASFTWTVSAAPGTGPAGPIRLDLGGKCLNDVGNSAASGTQLDIWTCTGSTSQKWTYAADETLRIHGTCLTAQGTAGWKVLLEPCTGAPAGEWRLVYPRSVRASAGSAPLTLVNPASRWCLADPGGTANGTRMVADTCSGKTGQEWQLPAGPVWSQLPGKCLDDHASSTTNGNKIDIWTCKGTSGQTWTLLPDGTVRVRGKCLDVHGAGTASGTPVDLWSCNGTSAQQWQLASSGPGVSFVNPHSGKCLTDPGDGTGNGTAMQIAACARAPGQQWRAS